MIPSFISILPRWRLWRRRQTNICAFALVLLLAMASCGGRDEAEQALDDARRLAAQGDYEGALAKQVWFHDHALSVNPSYRGVRLSFALSDWIALGKKYPKALETLKKIRDVKTSRLLAGEASQQLFVDVEAINQNLDESNSTVELFKRIETVNPRFAGSIYENAEKELVQAREYSLAKKYLSDPVKRLATARLALERGMEFSKSCEHGDVARGAFREIFAAEVVRMITILNETGDKAGAKEIQTEALKTLDDEAIKSALAP